MDQQIAPYPLLKSFTDKLVSLTLLFLFSPIFILVILAMVVSMLLRPPDRGSLFYLEPRITRGRVFQLLKFRTLRQDIISRMEPGDKHARLYEGEASNLTWAGHHLLKKWYVDELPQLINILKGDMSLVGPRPWPISLASSQIKRGVMYRNLILAGWTGPSQLQKGNPTPENSEKLDLEYSNRCRTWPSWRLWWYDATILCQTIRLILEGKGLAY
jgi:lipopolysaccharide/colanic/teichoic acid biosynthesis glycosyltransferase